MPPAATDAREARGGPETRGAPRPLTVLYRGPLSSCNYACAYCPFAKRRESRAELARDRAAVERFVAWAAEARFAPLSVFFTPWGEALVRAWYRDAVVTLSRMPHVRRVAVQTNLSCGLGWLSAAEPSRVGLWCTFHPDWTPRTRFVRRCLQLRDLGVGFSAGIVGYPEHLPEAEALRRDLPDDVYVWVNAVKRPGTTYADDEIARFVAVDPRFRTNLVAHPSRGRACFAGEDVVSVDGDGVARRCHFVPDVIGDLYDPGFAASLRPRPCPNATCGCHIGYVHLADLGLREVYGDGLLERVPAPSPAAWGARELAEIRSNG